MGRCADARTGLTGQVPMELVRAVLHAQRQLQREVGCRGYPCGYALDLGAGRKRRAVGANCVGWANPPIPPPANLAFKPFEATLSGASLTGQVPPELVRASLHARHRQQGEEGCGAKPRGYAFDLDARRKQNHLRPDIYSDVINIHGPHANPAFFYLQGELIGAGSTGQVPSELVRASLREIVLPTGSSYAL